ncbi:hypothetical protein CR513_55045, partial [Mucuna pruriens]
MESMKDYFGLKRYGIRFGTLPRVVSALTEMLSLSAGSAYSPATPHCCLLLHREVMPFRFVSFLKLKDQLLKEQVREILDKWTQRIDVEHESCVLFRSRYLTANPFGTRCDNLLSILEVEAQPTALSVLTQYYDPSLRCFTFKDFKLTPTLEVEEYECLLGLPLAKTSYYFYRGHYPSWAFSGQKKNRNGLEGLQRIDLEERLHQILRKED